MCTHVCLVYSNCLVNLDRVLSDSKVLEYMVIDPYKLFSTSFKIHWWVFSCPAPGKMSTEVLQFLCLTVHKR